MIPASILGVPTRRIALFTAAILLLGICALESVASWRKSQEIARILETGKAQEEALKGFQEKRKKYLIY